MCEDGRGVDSARAQLQRHSRRQSPCSSDMKDTQPTAEQVFRAVVERAVGAQRAHSVLSLSRFIAEAPEFWHGASVQRRGSFYLKDGKWRESFETIVRDWAARSESEVCMYACMCKVSCLHACMLAHAIAVLLARRPSSAAEHTREAADPSQTPTQQPPPSPLGLPSASPPSQVSESTAPRSSPPSMQPQDHAPRQQSAATNAVATVVLQGSEVRRRDGA